MGAGRRAQGVPSPRRVLTWIEESLPFSAMSERRTIEEPHEWFDRVLPETVRTHPEKVGNFVGRLIFTITGDNGGVWTVTFDEGQALDVQTGDAGDAGFTVKMKDKNFVKMMNGEMTGSNAFMTGKLKFKGDVTQAIKLRGLLFS